MLSRSSPLPVVCVVEAIATVADGWYWRNERLSLAPRAALLSVRSPFAAWDGHVRRLPCCDSERVPLIPRAAPLRFALPSRREMDSSDASRIEIDSPVLLVGVSLFSSSMSLLLRGRSRANRRSMRLTSFPLHCHGRTTQYAPDPFSPWRRVFGAAENSPVDTRSPPVSSPHGYPVVSWVRALDHQTRTLSFAL